MAAAGPVRPACSAAWARAIMAPSWRRARASAVRRSSAICSSAARRVAASAAASAVACSWRWAASAACASACSARRASLRFTRGLLGQLRSLCGPLLPLRTDDAVAPVDRQPGAVADCRRCLRLERTPQRLVVLDGRLVVQIVDARGEALERGAQRAQFFIELGRLLFLGTQRVALVLEDPVDALVLALQLLEQVVQLLASASPAAPRAAAFAAESP